ncbi:hypothetical protein PAMP_022983 [Pampus punctatissimus]
MDRDHPLLIIQQAPRSLHVINFYLHPAESVPKSEMHAHDTDCDCDQSDDKATGDHNCLPLRLLKGEGFLPNSDMQLPNQTETRKVSGTNEKMTSQIVGPMTKQRTKWTICRKPHTSGGLSQGPSVVLSLAEKVPPGVKFYHNNLFTTLSPVDDMTLSGYDSCGMIQQTQLHNIPFTGP